MSNLPTLIVDGDPADWLPWDHYGPHNTNNQRLYGHALPQGDRNTVRLDGPLPTVFCPVCNGTTVVPHIDRYGEEDGEDACPNHKARRPLRAGDRVQLATMEPLPDTPHHPFPFATATVADVQPDASMGADWNSFIVTVADVEAL